MSKYKEIQREKLSGKSLEIYDKLKKASNNFENTEGKIGEALDKFYNKVEKTAVEVEKKVEPKKDAPKKSTAKKSTKKKTTKKKTASKKPSYKNVNQGSYAKLASKIMKEKGISYKEAQKEASKIFAEDKKAKREAKAKSFSKSVTAFKKKYGGKGTKNTDIQKDADIPAKPVGKRVSKSGKVYYEYRDNRTDQKQPQPTDKPRLAKGGTIMSSDIKEKIFDENGERKIDKKSIEILTEYVNSLEQTKSANQKDGKYTPSRKKLHGKIIEKFKDGVVCIDNNKPIAILMGGSPASGKSTFLKKYAPYLLKDEILRIDADEVRAMLPEYEGWNASQTHLETKDIVNTLLSDRTIGLPCETDIIYDGTMNSNKSYLPLIEVLRKLNYKIFVVYIDKVPKDVIVDRALNRYKSSGRFVPLEVIDDFFDKGKSALNEIKKKVDGYMIVDGSGGNYKVIEEGGIKLPKTRKYGKIGSPMKKKMEFGGDIAESYDVRPPYGTYAKGGKMKRDWSTYYNDGGMVQSKVDSLSKGDIIVITYDDSIANNNKVKLKVRSRNKVRKGTVDKITFNIYDKPNSVKFYAYNRGSKWGFAKGDLAIVVKSVESDVKMHDGGMVEGYDVRSPYGTYAKGGNIDESSQIFVLQDEDYGNEQFRGVEELNEYLKEFNKGYGENYKTFEEFNRGESKQGRRIIRTYAEGGTLPIGYHRMPDGEIMADSEHFAKGGNLPSLYDNPKVFTLEYLPFTKSGKESSTRKFKKRMTLEAAMDLGNKMHQEGDAHTIFVYPDKDIMVDEGYDLLYKDSSDLAKGGYVCMNCGEYAMGGKVKTTKRKKRKR